MLSVELNSIRLGGPAHGMVTKTVHKTLRGYGDLENVECSFTALLARTSDTVLGVPFERPFDKTLAALLPPATKLGQGYVFTGVCDSVNRGRGGTSHPPPGPGSSRHHPPGSRHPPPEQTSPQSRHPPGADPPGADTPTRAVRILLECNLIYLFIYRCLVLVIFKLKLSKPIILEIVISLNLGNNLQSQTVRWKKKGGKGSTRNPMKHSKSSHRGVKKYPEEYVEKGMILHTQLGLRIYPGENVRIYLFNISNF